MVTGEVPLGAPTSARLTLGRCPQVQTLDLLRPEGLAVAGQEPLGIELLGNLRVVEVLRTQQEHVRRRPLVVLIRDLSSGPSSWGSLVAQGSGLSSLPRWSGAIVSTRPAC
jgi:hypothetical protein